jgi:hypothetical protein
MCSDFFYNSYLKHFSLSEELSEIWSKMSISLHVKYMLFLSDFNEPLNFSTHFRKIVAFRNFAYAP